MTYLGLVILFLALSSCGALLWQSGARHREGYAPHCAYCENDLSGGPLTECWHCKRPLPENKIRVGQRAPLPRRILLGKFVLALGGVAFIVVLANTYRLSRGAWYCFRPTFMLIKDLNGELAGQAAEELGTRCRVGVLTGHQAVQAADILLERLADASRSPRHVYDLLGTLWEHGLLTDGQRRIFIERIDRMDVSLAAADATGSPRIVFTGRVRSPNGWVPLRIVEAVGGEGSTQQALFREYHWAEYDSAATQPTEIALSQPGPSPITLRLTTIWNSFKADLLTEDLRRAQGEERRRLLRLLDTLEPTFITAYSQEFVLPAAGAPATARSERQAMTREELGRYLQALPESRPD